MFPVVFVLKVAFISFTILVCILVVILRLMGRYFKNKGDLDSYRLTKRLAWLLVSIVVVGMLVWIDAKVIEPNWIQTKYVSIESPRFSEGLQELTIVQISDLHVERIGYREKELIRRINRLKPDVILTNGDFVNSRDGWKYALEVLGQLRAKKGIYTLLGNTDYHFPLDESGMTPNFGRAGVSVLYHDNLRLDFGSLGYFWLVGVSDKFGLFAQGGDSSAIQKAFLNIPADEPKVLLMHDPEHALVKSIANYNPDLILAGDTHGGQVGIPFLRQFSDYANRSQYMAGLFHIHNGIPLYVNRGIGMKTLNVRFLCRPEITVIKLIKK